MSADIAWAISDDLVDYPVALKAMEERAAQIIAGTASELIWLLEHPPLYTSGTSAKPDLGYISTQTPTHTPELKCTLVPYGWGHG